MMWNKVVRIQFAKSYKLFRGEMIMFKKFFALLLAGVLMASLVACGNFD